ncbi:MAG: carbon starvation protein A [Candidatus Omnitrophota bacterium]
MSAVVVVVPSLALLFLGYRYYARRIERLWGVDSKRATPAFSKYDSVDYIPAKNWLVLFGHHFSSISGAGPVIGPVIAVIFWGWLPALLWVVFGTIFIGGVHDFGSLITSVREGGSSVADISRHVISRRTKVIFSLFLWLTLLLIVAVFAYLCADTFVKEPRIVLPSLGLIPVAIIVGHLIYNLRLNTGIATILGLVCICGLMFAGNRYTVQLDARIWVIVLLTYCYFASILPVNILLQPRDYLSSFFLFFGVACGYLGLLLTSPRLTMPAYQGWHSEGGYLWPALFVTVACGALSGFHSLIASGTSSKQLANERQAKRIGYGGMVAEALVAILAIVVTAALFNGSSGPAQALKSLGPINIFGRGYGIVARPILGSHGHFIAIIILNIFILTTLDTATRIQRYITEELFGIKNRYISTLIIVVLGAGLALSGKWSRIWLAFGASNQLVAALALFVISCWLLLKNKTAGFTLWAAFAVLVTTVAALVLGGIRYFTQKDIVLLAITLLLLVLAGLMLYDIIPVITRKAKA